MPSGRPVPTLLALVLLTAAVAVAAGVVAASAPPRLTATGPTSVTGTEATAVFTVGRRTVRQVRYHDRGTLVYRFRLRNDGPLPVTVTGLAPLPRAPRLLRPLVLRGTDGDPSPTVPAGGRVAVVLALRMRGCESLSARAGSFATRVRLRTTRAGLWKAVVTVRLPEQLHTGSPREAFCPRATATSRPPG